MRIGQVILRVDDLERSVQFWTEAVGLQLSMRAGSFAFLDGRPTQLTLNEVEDRPADDSLNEIVFEVEDVSAAFDELSERGVRFEVDLRPVTSDGDRELWAAHFYDPDGHLASVVGWVGP
ncbi:MAG TPA: VOC family protein [Acidimicrobiia bacterium]|nr:VOC family protein [Acidimicrobiia bacterium]